ncbi:MAG: hypothetical protein ACLQU1_10130 [Bryobacteraceae bacterium]
MQRTVLYLGEINDQQQAAWRKSLEVFDEDEQDYRTVSPLLGSFGRITRHSERAASPHGI